MDLTIRGRLTAETGLPQYTWEATNGIRVVNGASVEAHWPKAIDTNSINAFREMEDGVERAILVENLETVSPLSIRWEEYQEDGSRVFTPTFEQSWNLRRGRQPLYHYEAKAELLVRCSEVREALEQLRLAMEHWRGDAKESMARLYLAAETLVLTTQKQTTRKDWQELGEAIGFGGDNALRLFFSLQVARHVNVSHAEAELSKMGVPPLYPDECVNEVVRLLDAYIATRMPSP